MSAAAADTPTAAPPMMRLGSGKSSGELDGILAVFSRLSSLSKGKAKEAALQIMATKVDRKKRIAPIIKMVVGNIRKDKTLGMGRMLLIG